jgi:AcrR family transcriptional regulator
VREIFRERGLLLQMEEVAERAGIGMGTLYRNFPSREEMIAEIVLEQVAASRDDLLEIDRSIPPWDAFEKAVRVIAFHTLGTTPLSQLASIDAAQRDDIYQAIIELIGVFSGFVASARQVGQLRDDISPQEILELIVRAVLTRVPQKEGARLALPEGFSDRVIEIVLDGLRVRP